MYSEIRRNKLGMYPLNKSGIALLITLFFVMAITVALGVGLRQVKEASWHVEGENFMLQSSVILDDVLTILATSKELDILITEQSTEGLFAFISSVSFIPFESSGVRVRIQVKSARAKFNPNSLLDANSTITQQRANTLKEFLSKSRVQDAYVDILLDAMGKVKEDASYTSGIFAQKPSLFRDYLTSHKHLGEVNDFYKKTFHDNSLSAIDFENLFYFSKNSESKIDVNYATQLTWEMLLGCTQQRAKELAQGGGTYKVLEDLGLSEEERLRLELFDIGYFEPYLDVLVEIAHNTQHAKIRFEYDIYAKKGTNFVYEI